MTSIEIDKANEIAILSRLHGLIQGIACMEGATITKALTAELEYNAERLSIYIGQLFAEDVKRHEDKEKVFDGIIR